MYKLVISVNNLQSCTHDLIHVYHIHVYSTWYQVDYMKNYVLHTYQQINCTRLCHLNMN